MHLTQTGVAESLALYTQAALQGTFIIAKARGESQIASELIAHLRRYGARASEHRCRLSRLLTRQLPV